MKKTYSLKRITNLIAVIVILLGVIPFAAAANITTVYADDGGETTEPAAPAAEEAQEIEETAPAEDTEAEGGETAPAEETEVEGEAVEEADATEETEDAVEESADAEAEEEILPEASEAAVEEPADAEAEEEILPEASEAAVEETVETEADVNVSEIVEMLSEADVQIVGENGEALPLASVKAVEVLANSDPFFWDSVKHEWVGYTESGSGCPANVTCIQNDYPFQEAVNQAGVGNTIYVASGEYHENVVVDHADQSFAAFHSIAVTSVANAPVVTMYTSGYAVVDKITLNVDFGTTLGVYANEVIVNGTTGGQLDDGMALVNDGGTVEADVVLKSGGGYFVIQDAHNSSGTEYEFECGEPDVYIYQKGTNQNKSGEYRMVFMKPTHEKIVDYYTIYSKDERSDIDPHLVNTPLAADLRLEHLVIGVNVSERDTWNNHNSEKKIYWNLLGNTGNLTTSQQNKANSITDGSNNGIDLDREIWFMWPTIENPNNKDGKTGIQVNAYAMDGKPARQLTFIQLSIQEVLGCMDPEAENYDPNATVDNEKCEYPIIPPVTPPATTTTKTTTTVGLAVPIEFIIPVTGQFPLITAGIGHTCALTAKEGLECWGLNESGQVGDSSFDDTLVPVDVVGIDPSAVIGLVSGIHHTCVLTSANEVFCWGLNSSGQLGDGTTENRNEPILVDDLEGKITSISAGAEFTCALNDANDVFCWGNNSSGQLNDGTEDHSSIPVKTTTVSSDTVLISGGSLELQGITSDGAMQLWNSQPVIPVTGLPEEDNAFVSADRFTEGGCTMTDAGNVNCWGGITDAQVKGAVVNDMLSSGKGHACTMKAEGLVCWGSNSNGQLGDDSTDDSLEETLVVELEQGVIALTAGMKHTCVIYADEDIACWGLNDYGQLGNDTIDDSMVPVNTK